MRGGYFMLLKQLGSGVPESRVSEAVERAKRRHAEECELRLARIQNGAEKSHQNGRPYEA